jgi:5-methylcytosine-specific restriction protein A
MVFRYLTDAEFFNIYKPLGTETGGGGQSYIDFPIGFISPEQWNQFFLGMPSTMRKQGPSWTFQINSIGLNTAQGLTVFQRSFSFSA